LGPFRFKGKISTAYYQDRLALNGLNSLKLSFRGIYQFL
jgi:hypothetical protein